MTSRILLREATAEVHARLHRVPVFEALAAGHLSLAAYAALLSGFGIWRTTRADIS